MTRPSTYWHARTTNHSPSHALTRWQLARSRISKSSLGARCLARVSCCNLSAQWHSISYPELFRSIPDCARFLADRSSDRPSGRYPCLFISHFPCFSTSRLLTLVPRAVAHSFRSDEALSTPTPSSGPDAAAWSGWTGAPCHFYSPPDNSSLSSAATVFIYQIGTAKKFVYQISGAPTLALSTEGTVF